MNAKNRLKTVVFLDRDGVINRDSHNYIKTWSEFEFLPGSLEALRLLNLNGFNTILITNQSIINRKMAAPATLMQIHRMMQDAVTAHGGHIKDIFYCPHTPQDDCDCRKPRPGLIFQAQLKYDIDLTATYMVGDNAKDIECARNAGCGRAVLVKSGLRSDVEQILTARNIFADIVAENLLAAVKQILHST